MATPKIRERGSAIVEFLFAGIPLMLLVLVIFELCIAMWSYHTLAAAVEDGAIYASTKGQDCTLSGNTCQVSISAIAQDILSAGPGIASSQLSLTFHSSASGYSDITCTASSCLSNTTLWPPGLVSSGPPAVYGNIPGISYITITGTYPSPVPVTNLIWMGRALAGVGTLQFSATSQQIIQY